VALEDLRGKVVLLEFWSAGNEPWMRSLPDLIKLRQRLAPHGFEILGVNLDPDPVPVRRFLSERGIDWPQLSSPPPLDPNAATLENDLQLRWGVGQIPLDLVIDRDGTLVEAGYGHQDRIPTLERLLDLGPGKDAPTQPGPTTGSP
jgi:hypothetical protein